MVDKKEKTRFALQLSEQYGDWTFRISDHNACLEIAEINLSDSDIGMLFRKLEVIVPGNLTTSDNLGKTIVWKAEEVEIKKSFTWSKEEWEAQLDAVAEKLKIKYPEWQLVRSKFDRRCIVPTPINVGFGPDNTFYRFVLRRWLDKEESE